MYYFTQDPDEKETENTENTDNTELTDVKRGEHKGWEPLCAEVRGLYERAMEADPKDAATTADFGRYVRCQVIVNVRSNF